MTGAMTLPPLELDDEELEEEELELLDELELLLEEELEDEEPLEDELEEDELELLLELDEEELELLLDELEESVVSSMVETLRGGSATTQFARLTGTEPTETGAVSVPSILKTRAVPESASPAKETSCNAVERLSATMT